MFKYLFAVCFFLFVAKSYAQDPHMREAESVEEILKKNNPEEFEALQNHEKYLVIEKIGSTKRKKIFIDQEMAFLTMDDIPFKGNLTRLTDSTLSLTYFDNTMQRYELRMFYLKDIQLLYKRSVQKGLNYKLSPVTLLPLALDWIYFKRKPWENINTLYYIAGIEAARILIANRKKFFNKYKFNEKRRLRVFQY
ncbi:hypothetical protein [Arcticibacterium luteifluviistationis]|uniref:Uncharacterized protein n=1 Tax=Arcticibacterium luteifluviistationis TaxID=1784714 RepID=A0A2Z4G6B9_9BACT|nr:hypothetical protein [Arcticibacterium luteifluviistationis]AWV96684.1 hypothetical protein DJ013_00120 [Arcticibacterium luteifluviistationis]